MTFHVSCPKSVLNPYELLSGSRENRVDFRSEGLDIVLDIFISVENEGEMLEKKTEIRFFDVCSFRKDSFPGVVIPTDVTYDNVDLSQMLGSLIEFEKSAVADAWTAHFENRRQLRHYIMHFLSENIVIGVFATGYEFADETNLV